MPELLIIQDAIAIIARDNPVLYALVLGVGGLLAALRVLWKWGQGRQEKLDSMALQNIEIITAMKAEITANREAFRNDLRSVREAIDHLSK